MKKMSESFAHFLHVHGEGVSFIHISSVYVDE